jgi:hypothetical protein
LPLQDLYCNALDQELENQRAYVANYTLVLGHKFVEPLNARRLEHEKARKSIKTVWAREQKRLQEALSNLRKARDCYVARRLDLQRARHTLRTLLDAGNANLTHSSVFSNHGTSSVSAPMAVGNTNLGTMMLPAVGLPTTSSHASSSTLSTASLLTTNAFGVIGNPGYPAQSVSSSAALLDARSTGSTCPPALVSNSSDSSAEQLKIDRKRKSEEEAVQRALEAEAAYKYSVIEANERFVVRLFSLQTAIALEDAASLSIPKILTCLLF